MNVVILGTDIFSQVVTEIIEHHYNPWLQSRLGEPINVVGYVAGGGDIPPVFADKSVLHFNQFAPLYQKGLIDKIIFPREVYKAQVTYLHQLLRFGVKPEDVYMTKRLDNPIDLPDFMENYFSAPYMPYLEFRIADHCNMNCKACADFSGLVKKPHFPNLQKFTRDFERLHEFIDDIGTIRILGGEPLLNPEINEYIKLTRRLYPRAEIHVVTNALILMKMPDEFFDTVRENDVIITISFYLPLVNDINKINNFLNYKGVKHVIQSLIEKFFVNTTLTPHDNKEEMFFSCQTACCRDLWEGKVSTCYKVATIGIFNEYFNTHLPEDSGLIDLYDETLTTEKLKRKLFEPFELCRYCTPFQWREWGRISYPASINDLLAN